MTYRKILILGGTTEARQLAAKLAARERSRRHPVACRAHRKPGRSRRAGAQRRVRRRGGAGSLSARRKDRAADRRDASLCGADLGQCGGGRAAGRRSRHRSAPPGLGAGRRRPLDAGRRCDDAVAALGKSPRKIFLALGRQEIAGFEAAPQHAYVIRSVDPVEPPLAVPDATYILARGPFSEADDRALLEAHGIDAIVAKNSGGTATYGKIAAARKLGIDVFLFRRPALPDMPSGAERR